MLTRRAPAMLTLFFLLIGLLAVPRGPLLVCRITGMPMIPVVVAAPNPEGSCCDIAAASETDGAIRYTLTAPGCCELTRDSNPQQAPAIGVTNVEHPVLALFATPTKVPVPDLVGIALQTDALCASVPRAPPLAAASPRAPPAIS